MSSLLRFTSTVFILSLVSKVFGLIRDILLVNKLGIAGSTDGYYAALNIIDFMITFFGLLTLRSISTTFFTEAREKKQNPPQVFSIIIITVLLLGGIISLIPGLWPAAVLKMIMPGFSGEFVSESVPYVRILAALIVFRSLFQVQNSILGVKQKFFYQNVLLPLINVALVTVILFSSQENLVVNLCIATSIAYALACLFQFILVWEPESKLVSVPLNILAGSLGRIVKTAVPLLMVTAVFSLAAIIDKTIASFFQKGVITSLVFSQTICTTIINVLLVPISNVLFPRFSSLFEGNKKEELNKLFRNGQIVTLLIFIPFSGFFVLYSKEVLEVLFFTREVSGQSLEMTAGILRIYGISLVFHSAYYLPSFFFQAARMNKKLSIYAVISAGVNIAASYSLSRLIGYVGIPIGTVISLCCYSVLLTAEMKKKFEVGLTQMMAKTAVAIAVSAGGGLTTYLIKEQAGDLLLGANPYIRLGFVVSVYFSFVSILYFFCFRSLFQRVLKR